MSRTVRVAAIQLPTWAEGETDTERKRFRVDAMLHWLEEAGLAGADLVCLGETCTSERLVEEGCAGLRSSSGGRGGAAGVKNSVMR